MQSNFIYLLGENKNNEKNTINKHVFYKHNARICAV